MAELNIVSSRDEKAVTFKSASGNWVVARRDYIAPSTKHGILMTAGGMKELQQEIATGTVICVGPGGVAHRPGQELAKPCNGGDRIMWSRYGERVLSEHDDGDMVAIPFPEVIGVVNE